MNTWQVPGAGAVGFSLLQTNDFPVDGRNPARKPPGMYKTLVNNVINNQPIHGFAGFLNHQECQTMVN